MPLVDAGEFFVGHYLAITESWRIFCWLISSNYGKLGNILMPIVMPLVNAGEYFVGFFLAIIGS